MRTWRETATLIARSARPPGWHPLGRAILSVVFVVPDHQRRDLDNLIAGTKPLTDGIVDAGILVDDSTRVIVSASYSWRYQRGVSATIYRIEGDPDTQELWGS
jgi:Holliday junction resolvase RusA-like endonuclease